VTEFGNTLGTQDKHTECMLKHTITGMRQRSALTGGWRQHHILLVKHLSVIQPAQQAVCVHKCVEELLCVSRQALSQYIVVREIHRIFFLNSSIDQAVYLVTPHLQTEYFSTCHVARHILSSTAADAHVSG